MDGRILWVAFGGALGSVLRFALSTWANTLANTSFPAGTLLVNLLGAIAVGALAASLEATAWPTPARLLLQTGFLGGFTTFSAFGLETFNLLRTGLSGTAIANIAVTNAAGLVCVALGFWLTRLLLGR
jgi:CrcB protein